MRGAVVAVLRLAGSMLLGIPVGILGYTIWQTVTHPWLGAVLLHHPVMVLSALTGTGVIGSLSWTAFQLAGIDLLRDATLLHRCIVAAACCIYLLAERRAQTT